MKQDYRYIRAKKLNAMMGFDEHGTGSLNYTKYVDDIEVIKLDIEENNKALLQVKNGYGSIEISYSAFSEVQVFSYSPQLRLRTSREQTSFQENELDILETNIAKVKELANIYRGKSVLETKEMLIANIEADAQTHGAEIKVMGATV